MSRFCFIINPVAGEGKAGEIQTLIPKYLKSSEYELVESGAVGDARQLAQKALENNTKVVVAVGGDGTINEIAGTLIHKEQSLGIIPAGSGNGLARNLGISLDPEKALEQLIAGTEKSVDAGQWNEHYFFNLMGVGLEASVSKRFRERKTRGFLAYAVDTFTEYMKLKAYPFHFWVDNEEKEIEAVQLTLCLGPQYGNEAYIAPQKAYNNDRFQLVVLKEVKLHRIPAIITSLFNQKFHELPEVESFECQKFALESNAPFLHLDAEVYPSQERIEVNILSKSLKIRY